MRRLLLLACSQRKCPDAGDLPAIERYDGPAYRVLRRYTQTNPQRTPDIYVLSAKFGLIRGDTPTPVYDFRMTPQRAQELSEEVAAELRALDVRRRYQSVFIHAGALYRQALSADTASLPQNRLTLATGSQGVQLAQLKSWLYQHPRSAPTPIPVESSIASPVKFKLRGREYEVTSAEALAVARLGVENGVPEASRATAWYVPVDGLRIAPKWLVSQLTGLPVGAFHSEEARRVLNRLELPVFSAPLSSEGERDE